MVIERIKEEHLLKRIAPLTADFRVTLKSLKGIVSEPDVTEGLIELKEYLDAGDFPYMLLATRRHTVDIWYAGWKNHVYGWNPFMFCRNTGNREWPLCYLPKQKNWHMSMEGRPYIITFIQIMMV